MKMDRFVFRLVERLTSEGPPLSRNRHFHTFVTPEGRKALQVARRLRSIARDVARAERAHASPHGDRMRLDLDLPLGMRTAFLDHDEFELLLRMTQLGEHADTLRVARRA